MAVLEILREKKIAIERSYGDLYVRNRRNISSMVALCKDELARIDKEDSKNELEEKVKRLTVENLEYQNNEAKYQKDIRVYKTISIILGISLRCSGIPSFQLLISSLSLQARFYYLPYQSLPTHLCTRRPLKIYSFYS